ncbi:MAG: hypothetical protein A3H52_01070 [Candidatus Zambryskibacteria bacterium RIFCSPLOWO2_02_FULL_39_26]|nr:MAG: hypothetical protein A3H52_01070 [Candidatus Zambryskibacteria bacterium RIFCSPLOWO2_02_FULL_39_26]
MKSSLPFIIIAICIGLYFLYISPTITDVQALRDQKAEYTNVLEKVQEIKEMRDAVSATYNNIPSADLNRLSKIVPERFNSTLLANDLNNLASKNGIVIKSFKESTSNTSGGAVVASQENPAYKTNVITISLIGQYRQFMNFLAELETSLQLVDVTSLAMNSSAGQKPTDNQFQYTLEINVYSLR